MFCLFLCRQKFQQISIAFKRLITDSDVVSMTKVDATYGMIFFHFITNLLHFFTLFIDVVI